MKVTPRSRVVSWNIKLDTMADYSRLDEELRGFAANFPGFDISVPPEQGARAMLKALGPPPPPDVSLRIANS